MKTKMLLALMLLAAPLLHAGDELAAGAKAPAFSLKNAVDGKTVTMKPNDGFTKVVIFTCNDCPYAKAFEPRLIEIANKWKGSGVRFYAVNSNDDSRMFADEAMDDMKERATEKGYPFPYLKDGDSAIARAYGARVTPHVYVVDGQGVIRYRGYVDDQADPKKRTSTGLTDALGALTNGREVAKAETRAFGCTIKFKG
ncbi:MAG TPA: thioredoxin family protein [Thermoanaerobaculia bacterium]|nr:thioredoxin family protein [Thermoanaerobaculia bacterium]